MLHVLAFSPDEWFLVVLSLGLACLTWILWYRALAAGPELGRARGPRTVLALAPPAALALVLAVLLTAASFDVRDSAPYLFQYLVFGAAWIGLATRFLPWLGVSARADVVERGNPAAAVALAGACVGLALCFAGGNVGDGPGWWVVAFSSGLATAAFLVAWALLEALAHPSDAITIDRDVAAGVRHAGFCAALGVVLGRAAAGDWVSAGATLRDFAALAWPALGLLALALVVERALRPSAEAPQRAVVAAGIAPAALHLALALAWAVTRGAPA
jgi:uncharacterized membrane protein YjfL (UPF0719 family)